MPDNRGPLPGEITLKEVAELWGLGHTRVWELVVRDRVVPIRRDYYRIYIKRADAEAYEHVSNRGRPRGRVNRYGPALR